MGFWDSLLNFFRQTSKDARVLVIGLDNSGKTTLINKLKPFDEGAIETAPTIGYQVEKLYLKNLTLTCFDMSGQGRYRNMWSHYYRDIDAIIFVIDSSDKMRFVVAKDELHHLLQNDSIRKKQIPILFFANKMDSKDSLSSTKCSQLMALDFLKNNPWHICSSNAITGEGVQVGIDWLSEQLRLTLQKR